MVDEPTDLEVAMSTLLSRIARRSLAAPFAALLVVPMAAFTGAPPAGAVSSAAAHRSGVGDGPATFGTALRGAASTGSGPAAVAVDPGTDTIYVANGYNANGSPVGGDTVSVIDGRRCQAAHVGSCRGPWPTVTVGNEPSTVTVDPTTHTVYVTNVDDNTVSVVDGRTCNGQVTSGCGQVPVSVPVGSAPIGVFVDQPTHTVYVGNFGGDTVSMFDAATCNGADTTGCPTDQPPSVQVGAGPGDIDVNPRTHTAYVATADLGAGTSGLTAFDTTTCNATSQAGCGHIGVFPLCADCFGSFSAKVDPANNTIYMGDGDTSVTAIDGRACNASTLAGCAGAPHGTVELNGPGFEHILFLAVDATRHTVYGVLQKDDTVFALDASVCNGAHPVACSTLQPASVHSGADPEALTLNPDTHTLYVANQVDDTISVIDASRCNADHTTGCRRRPPASLVPGAGAVAVDPANATAYVTSDGNQVSMVDTRSCNAFRTGGCAAEPATVTVGERPSAIAVDAPHHTAYVAEFGTDGDPGGSVSLLDTRACDAHPVGCHPTATVQIAAGHPTSVVVNPSTHAVYVGAVTPDGTNTISVFDGATCSSGTTTGCDRAPAVMSVGPAMGPSPHDCGWYVGVTVNAVTDTVYATNVEGCGGTGRHVYLFDGSTCGADDTSGCGDPIATLEAGANPYALTVDPGTDTVYAALLADGEHPAGVAVIDGTSCDRTDTSGCARAVSVAPAGFGAIGIALDAGSHRVFVANIEDASVSVVDGARCNGSHPAGCSRPTVSLPADDWPSALAVDPSVGTAYVSSSPRGTVSVIPVGRS